jgi:hypothetical protein
MKIGISQNEPIDGIVDIAISEPINKRGSIWFYAWTINVGKGPNVTIMQRGKGNR